MFRNTCKWVLVMTFFAVLIAGCQVRAQIPAIRSEIPVARESVTQAERVALTEFGKMVFSMDESGGRIRVISYQFSGWSCGSLDYSSEIVDASGWVIRNGAFSVTYTFDPVGKNTMSLYGTYDRESQEFSGTWEHVSGGEYCRGVWEAEEGVTGSEWW